MRQSFEHVGKPRLPADGAWREGLSPFEEGFGKPGGVSGLYPACMAAASNCDTGYPSRARVIASASSNRSGNFPPKAPDNSRPRPARHDSSYRRCRIRPV